MSQGEHFKCILYSPLSIHPSGLGDLNQIKHYFHYWSLPFESTRIVSFGQKLGNVDYLHESRFFKAFLLQSCSSLLWPYWLQLFLCNVYLSPDLNWRTDLETHTADGHSQHYDLSTSHGNPHNTHKVDPDCSDTCTDQTWRRRNRSDSDSQGHICLIHLNQLSRPASCVCKTHAIHTSLSPLVSCLHTYYQLPSTVIKSHKK